MSSWVQLLLLALLTACARFGVTEDPLPAALVELVRNSPINSIEDLQQLLTHYVEEEEANSAANGGHRLPRSPNPPQAKRAKCKLRTEVVELTRDMVDTTSANFLLDPWCVEVQRCSGCCNTRGIQCISNATNTRNVEVVKIVFKSEKPTYSKAVVSVLDHLDCTCKLSPHPVLLKKRAGLAPAQEQDGPAQEKASLI